MQDGTPTGQLDFTAPRKAEDLGIPVAMVHDIVLRQTLADGRTSTLQLSAKLRLSPILMTTVVEELRDLRYLEVQGVDGRDYLLAPTEAGRMQALDRMTLCRYTGPAPVSLEAYTKAIQAQHAEPSINLPALKKAFSDLVISDELLKEVGPSAIAGGAMFMYGPPGTGKSSIAERLLRVYEDQVMVPHAVEVDGQIITVFDPVVHRPAKEQPKDIDGRWLLCDRPFIIVGGELQGSMLDLAYQSNSGVYLAPIQMQANNGVLVIDDFGRQALTPQELLNRWIVPLDRQIDYLSLDYGMKFQVPFDAKIVFSTNLEPSTLGDEAFFRRIQSKILIPTIKDDQFDEVLNRVAEAMGVELTPDAGTHLRWMSRELGDGDLRPYLPAAVCKILKSICKFEDLPLRLDPTMIERIAHIYFTHAPERYAEDEAAKAKRHAADAAMAAPSMPKASIFGGARPNAVVAETATGDRDWTSVAAKAVAALKAENDGPGTPSPEVIEPAAPTAVAPVPVAPVPVAPIPAHPVPASDEQADAPSGDEAPAAPSWTLASPSETAPANP